MQQTSKQSSNTTLRGTVASPPQTSTTASVTTTPSTTNNNNNNSNATATVTQQPSTEVSPEFQAIISKVVQQSDPLDDPNFNITDYVNRMFPTENSLNGLELFMQRLNIKIQRLDDEILKEVREQTADSSKGTKNLEDAKRAIQELGAKIVDIKHKSDRSQKIVDEITNDIRTLDRANHNLTNAVSVLRRLKLYINSVEQLKTMAANKDYRAAGGFLEAVNQLDQHFGNYVHNQKVAKIHESVKLIRQTFTDQVYGEFKKFLENPAQVDPAVLNDSCYIIDALGKEAKDKFIKWFCGKELADYERFYKPGEESGKLENTERRYTWLMKAVKKFDDNFQSVFPAGWGITEMLCFEFCTITRTHLDTVLRHSKATNTLNSDLMVSALTRTVNAENGLIQRFGGVIVGTVPTQHPLGQDSISTDIVLEDEADQPNPQSLNPHSAAAIKKRWKKHQLLRQKEMQQQIAAAEAASKLPPERDPARFKGMLSGAFDPYMDLYIKKEDIDVRELLEKSILDETWTIGEQESVKVLASSIDLFYYYTTSLQRLLKIFKGPTLFELYSVYKKYLRQYSTVLERRIPSNAIVMDLKEEKTMCLIVNTADYCSKNTSGLGVNVKKFLSNDLAEKVDLAEEQASFETIISKAIKALVQNLLLKCEPALVQMTKMAWTTWSYVEDQSPYVNSINETVKTAVPRYADWLANTTHLKFFCDGFCGTFLSVYKDFMIGKCKKVSEVGSQQMMLDLTAIKSTLSDLPKGGRDLPVNSRYLKTIKKDTAVLENLLRVVLAPSQTLVETYKALIPEHTEAEFMQLLEFKGIVGSDRKNLLDAYKGGAARTTTLKKLTLPFMGELLSVTKNNP